MDEEEERAPSLYRPEAGVAINVVGGGGMQPLGSRGIAINVAQTTEATQRRQSLARLRRRIGRIAARRARRNVRQTRADVSERPRRFIQGAYLGQVCVSADGLVTLRRPAGGGVRRISGHGGHKRSLNIRLCRAAGDALTLEVPGIEFVEPRIVCCIS